MLRGRTDKKTHTGSLTQPNRLYYRKAACVSPTLPIFPPKPHALAWGYRRALDFVVSKRFDKRRKMWYNYTNTLDTALTLHIPCAGGVRHGQRWSKGVKCQYHSKSILGSSGISFGAEVKVCTLYCCPLFQLVNQFPD